MRLCRSAPTCSTLARLRLFSWAIEQAIRDVRIDEWRGRRAAAAIGLQVTGSLGLLGRAKILGLTPAVSPWVQKLKACGIHYHPELLRNFLLAMGE